MPSVVASFGLFLEQASQYCGASTRAPALQLAMMYVLLICNLQLSILGGWCLGAALEVASIDDKLRVRLPMIDAECDLGLAKY